MVHTMAEARVTPFAIQDRVPPAPTGPSHHRRLRRRQPFWTRQAIKYRVTLLDRESRGIHPSDGTESEHTPNGLALLSSQSGNAPPRPIPEPVSAHR